MAITTVLPGNTKTLRAVVIKSGCLGPGGTVLVKNQKVRMPESDAYTLVSGEQAEFIKDTDEAPAKPAADK